MSRLSSKLQLHIKFFDIAVHEKTPHFLMSPSNKHPFLKVKSLTNAILYMRRRNKQKFNCNKRSYGTDSERKQLDNRKHTSKYSNIKNYFYILELRKTKQGLSKIDIFNEYLSVSNVSLKQMLIQFGQNSSMLSTSYKLFCFS